MGEISIDPKFNIHETYKKVRILNPYRNSGVSLLSGTVGYYKFENNFIDEINGYNGQPSVPYQFDPGKSGVAASFNITSYVEIPDNNDYSITNSGFSISLFAKFTSQGAGQIIINKAANVSDKYEWNFLYDTSGLKIFITDGTTTNYFVKDYAFTPTIGVWYHLAMTYDGSLTLNGIKLYIDAVEGGTGSIIGSVTSTGNTISPTVLGVGGWNKETQTGHFTGLMDELKLFKRALTPTEINTEFNRL